MTYSCFQYYNSEVVALINNVLNTVKNKSFSDYVLLLARGGYQIENEKTSQSPYVISSQLEDYQDRTRERFLVDYLNMYKSILEDSLFMTADYHEYDLNIQMMIYAQIWESHQLLKTLKRIGGILAGKQYEWKILFEKVNKKGEEISVSKKKMIMEQILPDLKLGSPELAKFIEYYYDADFRNAFAHASYYINIEDNTIMSLNSKMYIEKKRIDLFEWEEIFINSVFFSYYLPHIISERSNTFIKDFPDKKFVELDWPLYGEPGKIIKKRIYPKETNWGVEFYFTNIDNK